jgi:4-hydroxybenzoate polyprenyltransferase
MLAMVGVRSATMSFNRLIDLPLVSRIPCTAIRALPQKQSGKRFAITSAPWVSGLLQAFMVILVALVLLRSGLCLLGLASLGPVTVLLTYEHSLIRPTDLGQVNAAFFTVDSWIGVLLSVATGIDIPWRRVS